MKSIRLELAVRLSVRREEIEQALVTRAHAIADVSDISDPEYVEGLRMALAAALDYGLAAVEAGEQGALPIPSVLYSQARMAARVKVGLETVLRRYIAGNSVLTDFILQEAEAGGFAQGSTLRAIHRSQAMRFERLIEVVSDEYARETASWPSTPGQRELERVRRLLAGELIDAGDLNYQLDASHVGLIAKGPRTAEVVQELAGETGKRLLVVHPDDGVAWAWIGSRQRMTSADLDSLCGSRLPGGVVIGVGEPAEGVEGWRLTHHQARAALRPKPRHQRNPVRYSDVALDASLTQDDLLAASLRRHYLAPLEVTRDGGEALREALRAYFACNRNVSSTAASLKLDRRTVANRLRAVEDLLERPLPTIAPQVELALRLHDLGEANLA